MPRRLALRLLIAWLAWVPLVSAQGPGPQGPVGPSFHGMAQAGGPYASPPGALDYRQQPTLQEQLLPATRASYDPDALVDLGIGETLSRTWFRSEYQYLSYRNPGSQFLGALPGVTAPLTFDPNGLFTPIDHVTGPRTTEASSLASLKTTDNRGLNGLRLTMGIPTQIFTLEGSAFGVGQSVNDLQFPGFINLTSQVGSLGGFIPRGIRVIPVIPLTRDGLPSAIDFILFDQGMNVKLTSDLQGGDTKLVFGAFTPNAGTEVAPLVGFNYIHLANRMLITGSDLPSNTNHRIDSRANNNIFGPEVGLRMETRSKWLTLGFEPKFTFGINRISNHFSTSQIFQPTVDPVTLLPLESDFGQKGTRTQFSPMIDLGTYARIRLAEHINLTPGPSVYGDCRCLVLAGQCHLEFLV